MEDNYEKQNKKVKLHAFFICLFFFIIGSIIGTFFLFLYPKNILCNVTTNKYLCNNKKCNDGFFGPDCLECKICINGYCDGSGTITTNNIPAFGTATGDGSTTAFTINSGRAVADVLVHVNGILMTPTADYTISGTTLTFATAPANGAEIVFRYLGY